MGESCLHSKGNFTLQSIDCVSFLTVKDKGYVKYIFFPFIVSNPRSHLLGLYYLSRIFIYIFIYNFFFPKAYQSPLVMNLQIWTIVCPHLWMLTFPFNPHTLRAPRILCGCLSNRQCGRLILIKKNDKCGGKIKSWDTQFAGVKYGAVADRNKWKDLDLLSQWCIHVINFCKKQNVWIDAALFRTFPLMR